MSNPNPLIGEEATTAILNRAAPSLPPPPAVLHLLSIGVCVRCIFRFSGLYDGPAYSCSSLTSSLLRSFLEERNLHLEKSESESESVCSVCLGILQFGDDGGGEELGKGSVEGFAGRVGEVVKAEAYGIDGFSLELSVPAAVMAANERALWLYMKRKYDCEKWLKDKLLSEHIISVKDALRLSVTNSLEKCLDAKSGVSLFCIRLTYTHVESSTNLAHSLGDDQRCKKRKVVTEGGRDLNGSSKSESDAAILKTLNNLEDDVFSEHIIFPPEKVVKPCHLTITCHRSPIYIGGRYLKFSRKVSQSRWIIDDERMGEASVEEIIGSNVLSVCRGDNYKFHAAGREDIDVRMLGSGRPFLIEVSNARCLSSTIDVQKITDTINNSDKKYVRIRNLIVVGSEIWALMREGEAEKQKQYAALVWITRPLSEEDIHNITSVKDMEILQRTPIRVLHRRSPLERKRVIHWMKVEKVAGSSQYFLLHLCTQAGTYIKEFVHGDLGRTHPSVGSILGCRSEILQLDVTDVKMDFFD